MNENYGQKERKRAEGERGNTKCAAVDTNKKRSSTQRAIQRRRRRRRQQSVKLKPLEKPLATHRLKETQERNKRLREGNNSRNSIQRQAKYRPTHTHTHSTYARITKQGRRIGKGWSVAVCFIDWRGVNSGESG